jgi:hypothetical protein
LHPPDAPETDAVFAIYIAALRQAFPREGWSKVEPYAHRIWMGCCNDGDIDWNLIKDRARREWRG